MSDVTTPHFDMPFRFTAGITAAVVEQDTDAEIRNCVEAVIRYPEGTREEAPTFGIPDQTFAEGIAIDLGPITDAVARWEPRATTLAQAENISVDELVGQVTVQVENGGS